MDGQIRLIDFGLASDLQDGKLQVLPNQIPHYAAPEVWNKKLAGLPSDWFAYGVIITYLYQLRLPFDGSTKEEIRQLADSGKPSLDPMHPQYVGNVKQFILKLLEVDPEKRLSKVSEDEFFGLNGAGVTAVPFKPVNIEIPPIEPSGKTIYFSENPLVYEILESNVIRIPPSSFYESDYYKSI